MLTTVMFKFVVYSTNNVFEDCLLKRNILLFGFVGNVSLGFKVPNALRSEDLLQGWLVTDYVRIE